MLVLCVTLYVVLLTVIYRFYSVFLAAYIFVLTLISVILYVLATKSGQAKEKSAGLLDSKEAIRISNLLRYATAVLSFISLNDNSQGASELCILRERSLDGLFSLFCSTGNFGVFQPDLLSHLFCHTFNHYAERQGKDTSNRGVDLVFSRFLRSLFLLQLFLHCEQCVHTVGGK